MLVKKIRFDRKEEAQRNICQSQLYESPRAAAGPTFCHLWYLPNKSNTNRTEVMFGQRTSTNNTGVMFG